MGKHRSACASLDLFSGIGGMTLALRGCCTPVAYCDYEQNSIKVLRANMKKRLLPKAPICPDVRKITLGWFKANAIKRVDIVIGGFPCVGFSPLGSRQGVKNEETALFFEIMRILDITRSPFVFLENVPNLLNLGMDVVSREIGKRGYELRWCIVSAAQMGAPHERRRLFCLGVKPGARFEWSRVTYTPFTWRGAGPSRTIAHDTHQARVRNSLLGNAVVPDAVRYAFSFLISRCTNTNGFNLVPAVSEVKRGCRPKLGRRNTFPACGILRLDREVESLTPPKAFARPKVLSLVVNPQSYRSRKKASPLLTSGLIKTPFRGNSWATPRHGMLRACNYLTTRSIRDLPTQIRFERHTRHRSGGMSPEFVEWMMGYPRKWTHPWRT